MFAKTKLFSFLLLLLFATPLSFIEVGDANAYWCVANTGGGASEPFWSDTACETSSFVAPGGSGTRWRAHCTAPGGGYEGIDATPNVTVNTGDRRILVFCAGNGGDNFSSASRNPSSEAQPGTYFSVICSNGSSRFPNPNPTTGVSNTDAIVCENGDRLELRNVTQVEPEPEEDPGDSGPGTDPTDPGFNTGGTGNLQVNEVDIECTAAEANNPESTNILCQLIRVVNFLSIGVAVVSAITVAVVGMQYTASKGDPGKTAAAVGRLTQVGLAILMYVFGLALLNWIIPGGAI